MRQYYAIKRQYPEEILFFRMGDFYEMFDQDALRAAKILNITLTTRNPDKGDNPLCGIPYHSLNKYLPRLLNQGISVAICEQVEDPAKAKGIVKRRVTRVVTPGTVMDDSLLEAGSHNFLCSINLHKDTYGLVFIDISTQDIEATSLHAFSHLLAEISKFRPKEFIVSARDDAFERLAGAIADRFSAQVPLRRLPTGRARLRGQRRELTSSLQDANLISLGISNRPELVHALAQAVGFLEEKGVDHVNVAHVHLYQTADYMHLDEVTVRHLELLPDSSPDHAHSLYDLLNHCKTAMGKRRLRLYLLNPLQDKQAIDQRLDIVDLLRHHAPQAQALRDELSGINDIERISGRLSNRSTSPRDLVALADGLEKAMAVKRQLNDLSGRLFAGLIAGCGDFRDQVADIRNHLPEDPPAHMRDPGFMRPSATRELQELVDLIQNSRQHLLAYEAGLREQTEIASLRIKHNKVFGYLIEVPKGKIPLVPESFKRKQTLANSERYITPELKDLEDTISHAKDRRLEQERALYALLMDRLQRRLDDFKHTAAALAHLDVLCAFAYLVDRYQYARPAISTDFAITIDQGRHPMVEAFLEQEFIANDFVMDRDNRVYLITGPNMAGKSTYLRQNALIILMAHIGCFVPARQAVIPLVDRIFTRIGSADYLSKGMSTFLVEMSETAMILNQASADSFILLDEIGRGTSTYDGISIAWAVLEYIHNQLGAKTLFATHYHELTVLDDELDALRNYCIQVKEWRDKLIFVRRIVEGVADRSYGIDVAKMAGIPQSVIDKAKRILSHLETVSGSDLQQMLQTREPAAGRTAQRSLFDSKKERIEKELRKVDIHQTTPMEALLLLEKMKKWLT